MTRMDISKSEPQIHRMAFSTNILKTSSVTIYRDNRAAIVREIPGIVIKPGRNEIKIMGLTSYVLPETIKVAGNIGGVVVDVISELAPRNPSTDSSSDSSSSDESPDEQPAELTQLLAQLGSLRKKRNLARNRLETVDKQGRMLEEFMEDKPATSPAQFEAASALYKAQREALFHERSAAQAACNAADRDVAAAEKREKKLRKKLDKILSPAALRRRERAERRAERLKLRAQHGQVYNVSIVVESDDEPRAGAAARTVEAAIQTGQPEKREEMDLEADRPVLRLSYITTGAYWAPKYEAVLDTIANRGSLTYRAEFANETGETWREAAITLSTSQNTFRAMEDRVPAMSRWTVGLVKSDPDEMLKHKPAWSNTADDGLYSPAERQKRDEERREKLRKRVMRERDAIGLPTLQPPAMAPAPASLYMQQNAMQRQMQAQHQQMQQQQMQPGPAAPPSTSPMKLPTGAAPQPPPSNHALSDYQMQLMLLEQQNVKRRMAQRSQMDPPARSSQVDQPAMRTAMPASSSLDNIPNPSSEDPYGSDSDSSDGTAEGEPASKKLLLSTSAASSYGMTTTYRLAGTRTVRSARQLRRYVLAEMALDTMAVSRMAVPKLRAAVFLHARITNTSRTELLRGAAGITVDGSFLGAGSIPRCAPGAAFDLPLGVDERVHVRYEPPVQKAGAAAAAAAGLMHMPWPAAPAEHVRVYTRRMRIASARALAADSLPLVVRDQVPVSEDARLLVSILHPGGLRREGDRVDVDARGATVAEQGVAVSARGTMVPGTGPRVGSVMLKAKGEVAWEIDLKGRQFVDLLLEYEVKLPGETDIKSRE